MPLKSGVGIFQIMLMVVGAVTSVSGSSRTLPQLIHVCGIGLITLDLLGL